MNIFSYEIWHIYSSFFLEDNLNLEKIAKKFISLDCAQIVVSSDTSIYYKHKNKVVTEQLTIKYENGTYNVELPANLNYVRGGFEYALQATEMFSYSERLFKEYGYGDYFDHIRIYLSPYILKNGDITIHLYPQIKIYSSGLIQILFRQIGKKQTNGQSLNKFIDSSINLSQMGFNEIYIPKGIHILFNYISTVSKFNSVFNSKKYYNKIKKFFNDKIYYTPDEFEFELIKFPWNEQKAPDNLFNIEYVLNNILETINYNSNITSTLTMGFNNKYTLVDGWRGSRNIYLLDYDEQPSSMLDFDVEEKNKQLISKIMSISTNDLKTTNEYMDLRMFNDYNLYLNDVQTLWITSKAIKPQKPNNADFIYDKQIIGEMLQYRFGLYEKLNFLSKANKISNNRIIEIKERLNVLNQIFHRFSSYGEITNLIKLSDSSYGIKELIKLTDSSLNLKKEKIDHYNLSRSNLFMLTISLIAGLFGSTSLANSFINPLIINYSSAPYSFWKTIGLSHLLSIGVFTILIVSIYYIRSFRENK